MAKTVKQFRFYNNNNANNQPVNGVWEDYVNGTVFENPTCFPILQLGIQALPGTQFYLNTGIEPITIGFTGIYELDLENQMEIIRMNFSKESMEAIESNANGYLIVDVLYEDGKEEDE